MRRSRVALLAMSLVAAAVCARLGLWQIDRMHERRARNAEAAARFAAPPLNLPPIPAELARFSRVRVTGVFDFNREVVLAGRSRTGAPGVHVATPLILEGSNEVLLVVRGWVYSPDAATVELASWRERDSATVEGYLVGFEVDSTRPDTATSRVVRRLVRPSLERRLGATLLPYYVIMTDGGASGDSVPRRLEVPVLDEGPHLSYSVQWFLFGTIFAAGGLFVTFRTPRPPSVNHSA